MRELTSKEIELVSGAGSSCYTPPKKKGNNGWGNGGDDGTNNGSDEGAQAGSKSADEFR